MAGVGLGAKIRGLGVIRSSGVRLPVASAMAVASVTEAVTEKMPSQKGGGGKPYPIVLKPVHLKSRSPVPAKTTATPETSC